jgi:hypothetical protein
MKKVIFALVALLIAAPAWADVLITCEDQGGGVVQISYDATGEDPNLVRAFALDITVSDGNIIDANCADNVDYYIYPGSIVIVDGEVTDYGSCVASSDYPGTLGGLGTGGVTLEMGSLYADTDPEHPSPPPASGVLCTLTVDTSCTVTINDNVIRGGVVMEDPDDDVGTNLPSQCDVVIGPPYPACWDKTQCHGDADATGDVKASDFLALKGSWFKCYPDPAYNPCADFDRDGCVKASDFLILKANWFKTVPDDCTPGGTWPPVP